MSQEELLYKIWDAVNETKTTLAVVKDRQDKHIEKQDSLAKDHYKLKEEFSSHKNKFLLVTSVVSGAIGATATTIINWLKS